jgi:hypothetical protein
MNRLTLNDRDHALLWIEENQLGRRNLSDDQRAVIALSVAERRSEMAREERARAAGEARAATAGRDDTGKMTASLPDTSTGKLDEATPERRHQRDGTRARVAKETKVSERKLRSAAEIEKADPAAAERIRRGESTIVQERVA